MKRYRVEFHDGTHFEDESLSAIDSLALMECEFSSTLRADDPHAWEEAKIYHVHPRYWIRTYVVDADGTVRSIVPEGAP